MSESKTLNVKATGIIALAVMLSRVLGLIREIVFNALFGTSSIGLFLIAFRAPNLLRDLFAEGALSISFITVFSKKMEVEGSESAWQLATKMLTLAAIFMSFLSLLGIFFAKPFISLLAPGFSLNDLRITILITQIMYPFILLVSLAAIVMGILNAKNVFGIPALASSFFNIGSIIGGVFFGWLLDPTFGEKALIGLAIGTLMGGFLQLWIQIPCLKHLGFHFKPNFHWQDTGIREILILTWPAIIAASAIQINVLLNTSFASYIGKEAVTWLNSAFRLMQLPIGLFGVAVATITLPVVSRIAVDNKDHQFGNTLSRAMQLAVFLTLPAAVGLWFMANPIIQLIYEHGKFLSLDTEQTALALQFYALGLVAYACIKVLSPAFYAINKKWTPMTVSFISIGLNIILNYSFIFIWHMGHRSLALSTSLSATFNFIALFILMRRHHHLQTLHFLNTLGRCSLAAAALGGFCWFTLHYFHDFLFHAFFWIRALSLLLVISLAAVFYMLICYMLKIKAANDIGRVLRKKLTLGREPVSKVLT